MKALKVFLDISTFSISLASIIFMGIVFYNESILGRGVLYLEPNRPLAFFELLICAFGGGLVIGQYLRGVSQSEKKTTNSYVEWIAESQKGRVAE